MAELSEALHAAWRALPRDVSAELECADSEEAMLSALAKQERRLAQGIARALGRKWWQYEEYLPCDQAADYLSWMLRRKGVPHIVVVGHSDEGSSHAWVRVRGRDYDPTRQGCSDEFEIAYRFDGKRITRSRKV